MIQSIKKYYRKAGKYWIHTGNSKIPKLNLKKKQMK